MPTRPYTEEKMLDVHRAHMLCGKYEGKKLLNICSNLINEEMIPFSKIKEFRESYDDQSNYKGVSEFKRILNYFIKEELVSELIDEISNYLNFKYNLLSGKMSFIRSMSHIEPIKYSIT